MQKYIDRLVTEWETHSKIIIGADFDSTLSPYPTIDNDKDIARCINLIKVAQQTGAYVVIYTCCAPGRYDDIIGFVTNNGIKVDAVNRNPIDLPFGHGSKPYCNIYLDDRSGFIQAMDILEQAIYTIRGRRQKDNALNQVF